MRNAYPAVRERKKGNEVTTTDQCYACNKFFAEKKSLERHLNFCGHMPGIVYTFKNQSIPFLTTLNLWEIYHFLFILTLKRPQARKF